MSDTKFVVRCQFVDEPLRMSTTTAGYHDTIDMAVVELNNHAAMVTNHWGGKCYIDSTQPLAYILVYKDGKIEQVWVETISNDYTTQRRTPIISTPRGAVAHV